MSMIFDSIVRKAEAKSLGDDILDLEEFLFHEDLVQLKSKYIRKLKTILEKEKVKAERKAGKNIVYFNTLSTKKRA